MNKLSTYELLYELLYGGKSKRHIEFEPMDCSQIILELTYRSKIDHKDDIDKWIDWFINDDSEGTSEEKSSMKTLLRIYNIEKKAKKGLGIKFTSLADG